MKTEEKKKSVPPLAMLAIGLLIGGVVVYAFRSKDSVDTKQEPVAQQTTPQNQNEKASERIIPEQAVPMASTESTPVAAPEFRVPAFHSSVENLTLAAVLDPASVPPEARAAYTVVKNKPKLIAQLPCFCYCERWGHGSLHDCFVTEHAVTCDICMNEVMQADEMDRKGIPASEIRETIITQFRQAAEQQDHTGHNH